MKISKVKLLGVVMAAMLLVVAAVGCAQSDTENGDTENTEQTSEALEGNITIAGSTSVQPLSEELASAFMEQNQGVEINVAGGGSGAGIKAAQEGTADIGASSRELKDEEKPDLNEAVIAKDGIAIVIHKDNGVENLTIEETQKIFAGEITDWKDVGGESGSINVFTREEGSGTRDAFEEIVMGDAKISTKAGVQNSTGAVRTAVAGDVNSIGYISLGSLDESVTAVKIDDVEPSDETIQDGTYKVARPFLYLTKGEPEGVVKAFIDFVMSSEGQEIVAEGFISVK
ncbi:MAG: phosphate ABC transporter substrate-binding protein [Syntrophaceticus sp.]|nr:phosphate ABC transporter substrate-binding protein [Syntrophaceticus sp.]